jgi:hypothetical protein
MPILTDDQIAAAIKYNLSKAGVLWRPRELPAPLKGMSPGSKEFAVTVARFQSWADLVVDGKLGPATFSMMRGFLQGLPQAPDGLDLGAAVPTRPGVSNQIIVNGQRVRLPDEYAQAGLSCSNWLDDGDATEDVHFDGARPRTKQVQHLVIHESVTNSVAETVRVLKGKGYGVHFMIAPDGHISCHLDPVKEQVIHGNQLNGTSIGVEVINPYSPKFDRPPYEKTIPAEWWTWVPEGGVRAYTLPTEAQMAALTALVKWLTSLIPTLPLTFPTLYLSSRQQKIPNWDKPTSAKPGPGIVAHSDYSSHADGRWPLLEVIRRTA